MNRILKELACKEILHADTFSYIKLLSKRLQDSQSDAIWLLRSYLAWTKEHSHPIGRRRNRLRLERKYGIYCGGDVEIGEGLKLPHPQGIIIGKGVKIGEDVTIYQQVTLGGRGKATESNLAVHERYPHIGSHVILYAGCKVVGHIELADGTIIGANAVLNKSTETGQTYVGVPAYNKASLEDKNVTHKKHV